MSSVYSLWKKEIKATLVLATPMIIAQLLQVGMGFIDTVMAGQLGARDLAAVGLGSALWMLVVLACTGTVMALSPLVAHLRGAGEEHKIAAEFQQGLWVAVLVGIIAMPVTYVMTYLIPAMNVTPDVADLSGDYLNALIWGAPGLCLYLAPRFFNEGMSNTQPVMLVQLLLLPLNIFGNYLFMYGNWGFPALGAEGAAISTAISTWCGAFIMMGYIGTTSRYKSLKLFHQMAGPSGQKMGLILKLGLPIALAIVMETGLFTAIALLMGGLGKIEMAAHQIALNYASLMFMVPLGISQAITIRVGHAAGAGDLLGARRRGWSGILVAGVMMLCSASVLLLFPEQIVSFYTQDSEVAAMALTLLFAAALFQFSDGVQVASAGALRGLKDTMLPMWITIFSYWLVGFPVAYYFGIQQEYGPQGLWSGLLAGLTLAALLLIARLWVICKRRAVCRFESHSS